MSEPAAQLDGGYAPKGFTMATALAAGKRLKLDLLFALGKLALRLARYAPLEKVATIHFASFTWVDALPGARLRQPYLLFASVFDGSPGEYLNDFGTLVPSEIDRIWSNCVGYPGAGARSGRPFIEWLGGHQIDSAYFYSGYEGETVPDVQHALALRRRVAAFVAAARGVDGATLRARFGRFVRDVQGLLG